MPEITVRLHILRRATACGIEAQGTFNFESYHLSDLLRLSVRI